MYIVIEWHGKPSDRRAHYELMGGNNKSYWVSQGLGLRYCRFTARRLAKLLGNIPVQDRTKV